LFTLLRPRCDTLKATISGDFYELSSLFSECFETLLSKPLYRYRVPKTGRGMKLKMDLGFHNSWDIKDSEIGI
jgi:hypothetical protein